MPKTIACRDIGLFDCDWKASAQTEEQLPQEVAKHAAEVHSVQEITPDVLAQVKAQVKDA